MASGYMTCACRDCFETIVGDDDPKFHVTCVVGPDVYGHPIEDCEDGHCAEGRHLGALNGSRGDAEPLASAAPGDVIALPCYCRGCIEAGCPDYQGQPRMSQECQRTDAYSDDE